MKAVLAYSFIDTEGYVVYPDKVYQEITVTAMDKNIVEGSFRVR